MEKELNQEELEIQDRLFEFFSHVEPVEHAGVTVYEPLFRVGAVFEEQLRKTEDIDPEGLNFYYANVLADTGFSVKDGLITSVSPQLLEAQALHAAQESKREKLISEKTALFAQFNIPNDTSKLDDKLFVKKSDFLDCINFTRTSNRIDKEEYKKIYEKNLDAMLNLIPNDKGYFKGEKETSKSIGYFMESFDSFISQMLSYHFEIKGGVPDQYKAPAFGGLKADEIKTKFVNRFKPEINIDVDPIVHRDNHASIISNFSKINQDRLSETCDTLAKEVVDNAREKLSQATTDEEKDKIKINTLLNVREYFLAQRKIYKSHFFLTRRFTKDTRAYRTKYDNLFDSLLGLGMEKGFVKRFLDNKTKVITIGNKTYDYEKIYTESQEFKEQLSSFDQNFRFAKNNVEVDLNEHNPKAKVDDLSNQKQVEKNLNK